MQGWRRIRRPSHGTIVGYVALFVALTGSAWAAVKVGSDDIQSNAILSKHVAKDALTGDDIKEGSLTISGSSLRGTLPNSITINGASIRTGTLPNTLTINGASLTGTIPSEAVTGISSQLEAALLAKARPQMASIGPGCVLVRGTATSAALISDTRCDVKFGRDVSACHAIVSPRDPASGQATGRLMSPIVADDNPPDAGGGLLLQGLEDSEVAVMSGADVEPTIPFYLAVFC